MTTETATLSVDLPLPPAVLSKNGRPWVASGVSRSGRRWYTDERAQAFAEVKRDSYLLWRAAVGYEVEPWDAAVLDIEWRHVGKQPDDESVIARVAPVRDAAQQAGIVLDDVAIRTGRVTTIRVPRAEQGCTITLRRAA